jgi:hypothetical protein
MSTLPLCGRNINADNTSDSPDTNGAANRDEGSHWIPESGEGPKQIKMRTCIGASFQARHTANSVAVRLACTGNVIAKLSDNEVRLQIYGHSLRLP